MKPSKGKDPMVESAKSQVIGGCLVLLTVIPLVFAIGSRIIPLIIGVAVLDVLIWVLLIRQSAKPFNELIKMEKRLTNKKNELKGKKYKTGFEELFILSCDERDDIYVNNYLRTIKNKKIKTMKIEPKDTNQLLISCKYLSFDIDMFVSNTSIELMIDSPAKYDGTKENKELEKKKIYKIESIHNTSIESLVDYLLTIIEENSLIIEQFKSLNEVDSVINGRLINKLSQISRYMKMEGFITAIGAPFFVALFALPIFMIAFEDGFNKNLLSSIIIIIVCGPFAIFMMVLFIYGIDYILKYINMKNDLANKRTDVIEERPIKVRLVRDQKTRYCSFRTIRYLVLRYSHHRRVIIPFVEYIDFKPKYSIKESYNECINLPPKRLTYLKKSKIVIMGGEPYIKIIKKNIKKSIKI